jgi:hypothetical protein
VKPTRTYVGTWISLNRWIRKIADAGMRVGGKIELRINFKPGVREGMAGLPEVIISAAKISRA